MKSRNLRYLFFTVLFFISGMTGLVYESVWTQYMRILTGHAAFAQSFILVIFLSGLAVGSWFGGKILKKFKNLFILYALIEAFIGIFALVFHSLFDQLNRGLFENLYPFYDKTLIDIVKWIFAIALTLPQTILLGATFPVLVQALSNNHQSKNEKTVSHLYFVNSIGASIGVLISAFYLSQVFGLPGSMMISGLTNIGIAVLSLVTFVLFGNDKRGLDDDSMQRISNQTNFLPVLKIQNQTLAIFILIAALLTGATSFIYEISWIRMLSMTLGSSTYAFELMLSAFILGLALGSLWIKFRLFKNRNALSYFAVIQILMGLLAAFSILGYNAVFDIMTLMLESLQRNEQGFLLFITGSHFIALVVMLPATIFAGMSLPLLIFILQQIDNDSDVVGKIYAIDTAGGILGVILGIHLLLPLVGVRFSLISASILDMIIGFVFFIIQPNVRSPRFIILGVSGLIVFFTITCLFFNLDSQKMVSGVFRYGKIGHSKNILFEKDGKTASIAVFETQKGNIVLTTNGKPDASVNIYRQITGDEATQVLLAALPLSFNYELEKVGIIGLGCGKTAHTALTNFNIRQVDVVEIEPVVYEAAGYFKDYVVNIFNDHRFKLHINDARTFFASTKNKYDLIISEPSNPWVSGIGSLFSEDFYKIIQQKLTDDGCFVQWIQTYEMTVPLVASIIKAMSPDFEDYHLFFMDDGDLAIIGKKTGKLKADYQQIFNNIELSYELSRIGVKSEHDFAIRLIGNKEILDPFFSSFPVAVNSDYYPFIEYQVAKAGFFQLYASDLEQLLTFPAPIVSSLMQMELPDGTKIGMNTPYSLAEKFRNAEAIFLFFEGLALNTKPQINKLNEKNILLVNTIRRIENAADSAYFALTWSPFLSLFAKEIMPFLPSKKLDVIWNYIQNSGGFVVLPENVKQQVQFYQAVGNRDFNKIIELTNHLHFDSASFIIPENEYFFACRMWAFLMLTKPQEAKKLWDSVDKMAELPFMIRLLGNLAEKRCGISSDPNLFQ